MNYENYMDSITSVVDYEIYKKQYAPMKIVDKQLNNWYNKLFGYSELTQNDRNQIFYVLSKFHNKMKGKIKNKFNLIVYSYLKSCKIPEFIDFFYEKYLTIIDKQENKESFRTTCYDFKKRVKKFENEFGGVLPWLQ